MKRLERDILKDKLKIMKRVKPKKGRPKTNLEIFREIMEERRKNGHKPGIDKRGNGCYC